MSLPRKLYIPAGIDIDTLVAHIRRSDSRVNVRDACCYVLHHLVIRPLEHIGRRDADTLGGTPVNIKTLQKAVGRCATDSVNLLIRRGIIERTINYSAGTHSRGYILTDVYRDQGLKEVSVESPALVKSLGEKEKEMEAVLQDTGLQHLLHYLTPEFITVDVNAAHYYLETWSALMYHECLKLYGKTKDQDKIARRTKLLIGLKRRISNMKRQLTQLQVGRPAPSRSPNNLRLQTNIVGLRSVLRNFLLFKGEPLVEIDMGAAQPFLLRCLLSPACWEADEKGRLISSSSHSPSSTTSTPPSTFSTTSLLHISSVFPSLYSLLLSHPPLLNTIIVRTLEASREPGYVSFASLFEKGDFYENLMAHVAGHYATVPDGFKTRKEVKSAMMYIMFEDFKKKKKEHHSANRVFQKLFPKEAAVLDAIKQVQSNGVALLLQRLEAIVILEHVTKGIAEKYPKAGLLTVHDAILTTEEYAKKVRQEMETLLTSLTGIKPHLRVKLLSAEERNREIQENIKHDFKLLRKKVKGKDYQVLEKRLLQDDSPLLLPHTPYWRGKTASTFRVWRKLLEDPILRSVYQGIVEGVDAVSDSNRTPPVSATPVVLPTNPVALEATTTSESLARWEVVPTTGFLSRLLDLSKD
jgi:hypothetical protein